MLVFGYKVNPESKTITLEGSAVNGYSALRDLKENHLEYEGPDY